MVSDMIRNRAVFSVSLMSMCWESTVSLALSWLLQFYYAYIHGFATQIIKTEFFCFVNAKDSEIMSHGRCPPSVSVNDELVRTSENEKSLESIKKWELGRIFNGLDRNRDGMVSTDDIQGLLEKLGLQYLCDDDMKIMINFPEHMNSDEFCRACLSLLQEVQSPESIPEKGELREAFCVFDKDGDGFISSSELQDVLLSLGFTEARDLENCEAMITRFDQNYDGKIDFVEFESMLTMLNRPL